MDSERPVKNLFLIYVYAISVGQFACGEQYNRGLRCCRLAIISNEDTEKEKVKLLCHECIKKYQNNLFPFVV